MGRRTTHTRGAIAGVLAAAAGIAVLVATHAGSPAVRLGAPAGQTGVLAVTGAGTATGAGSAANRGAAAPAARSGTASAAVPPGAVSLTAAHLPGGVAAAATSSVAGALAGATVSLTPAPSGAGNVVSIAAPAAAFLQPGAGQPGFPTGSPVHTVDDAAWRQEGDSAVPDAAAAGTAGWRAGMIGAYTAANDPSVIGWALTASGVALSSQAEDYMHATMRIAPGTTIGWPNQTLIGQVSAADAQRQLDSNLAVLRGVLGTDLLTTATTVVPVGPSTFGFEVDLKVTSLAAIAPHITDVWLGLATGLVSGPTSTIEGLAINVVDASGARASEWANGRDGDGGGIGNAALPPVSTADASFPDLTGGPPLQAAQPTNLPAMPAGETYVPEK